MWRPGWRGWDTGCWCWTSIPSRIPPRCSWDSPTYSPTCFTCSCRTRNWHRRFIRSPREQASAENLTLAPGHIDLTAADILLGNRIGRETLLRKKLAAVAEEFDFVLIDTPPSLGLLTVNALTAADELLVPVSVNYFALQGARMLEDTIAMIRENLGHQVEIGHVLCTFYDPTTKISARRCAPSRSILTAGCSIPSSPRMSNLEYAHSKSLFPSNTRRAGPSRDTEIRDQSASRL